MPIDESTQTPLSVIEDFLKEEEFPTERHLPDDEYPYERLIVGLGEDEEERPYLASIYFVNDLSSAAGIPEEEDDAIFLQFFNELPIEIDPQYEGVLAQWLLIFNGILPAGALNIARSEEGSSVYYLYNWACEDRDVDLIVFFELLSIMIFFSQNYTSLTQAIAKGEKSLEDAEKELAKQGLYAPGMTLKPPAEEA